MQNQIFNLNEFSARIPEGCYYDAQVSYIKASEGNLKAFAGCSAYFNFYSIVFVEKGCLCFQANGTQVVLEAGDLFFVTPYQLVVFPERLEEMRAALILVEAHYYNTVRRVDDEIPKSIVETFRVLSLGESQRQEFVTWHYQIKHAMMKHHLYQSSMMRHLIHFGQLFLSEMMTGSRLKPHDSGHKENIFRIFIHLAYRYFKEEHQVQFYADRMNITPVYLTRAVKEVSGNTVLAYLQSMLYNEACVQLSSTSKTIGEISEDLNFNDQSAFSNFFKLRAGMSPVAYRGR